MARVLRIPGREVPVATRPEEAGDLTSEELKAAGFAVELERVIEVGATRDGGVVEIALGGGSPPATPAPGAGGTRGSGGARGARGARGGEPQAPAAEPARVCEVELDSGARLWLRPESVYEMFGARPDRSALPAADAETWTIDPVIAGAGQTRGGVLDRIGKIAMWVVKPLAGVGKGFVLGKPVHNLAKAIEDQMHAGRAPGVYSVPLAGEFELSPVAKLQPAADRPVLVFLHGTLSSTSGSFGGLWQADKPDGRKLREDLAAFYGDTAYALEHYTLLESPVRNALELAARLPAGARLHLVSHSRGGLVGELLCLAGAVDKLRFAPDELARLLRQKADDPSTTATDDARAFWKDETDAIRDLAATLYEKQIRVERFVRVACPSEGTTLAMRQIDLWLSVYKHFIDKTFESAAAKFFPPLIPLRALLGLVAQPDAADRLPGLWSMVPGNPLISLVNLQALTVEADLSVISGNNEGKGLLKGGLEVLLNKFFRDENDYVVNTGAMYGGLPRARTPRFQLDKGERVNHFSYFRNPDSVRWLGAGLLRADADSAGFRPIGEAPRKAPHLRAALKRRVDGPQPVVYVLPGIMGSELSAKDETIWLNYGRLAFGRLGDIAIDAPQVAAPRPIDDYYGELIDYLGNTHEVKPFAYDWRRSIVDAGRALGAEIEKTLAALDRAAPKMPVRIVAHSMGGLVVRAMLAERPDVWQRMIAHEGARVLMLGTPNGGSFEIVRLLLAQSGTLHKLALLDLTRGTRRLLEIITRFPGVLELLPGTDGSDDPFSFDTWKRLAELDEVGAGDWSLPDRARLNAARAAVQRLAAQEIDPRRFIYVAGCAEQTPAGWVEDSVWDYFRGTRRRTVAFVASPRGDGRVLWDTGIPPQVRTWYMHGVEHGDLANAPQHFDALLELVESGNTTRLHKVPPARRAAVGAAPALIRRDVVDQHPTRDDLLDDLLGRGSRGAQRLPLPDKARVSIVHGDLAYARHPVMVGHYAGDTIVGAEDVLDRSLKGALRQRAGLGLYAGAIGTSTVVLQQDRMARPAGAVVVGLGRPDTLSPGTLREGVTRAALDYALAVLDAPAERFPTEREGAPRSARLSCLLVGTGAGGMAVRNAITAMLGGIGAANRRLADMQLAASVWIDEVEFLELWLDRAGHAAEALELALKDGELADLFVLDGAGGNGGTRAVVAGGQGALRRIDMEEAPNWWSRLEIAYEPERDVLRFVAMTDRARAEVMLVAGQLKTAEKFIERAIRSASRDEEISRTLFEMLVPNRLKELAPDQKDVWLLVDERSGGFPWELLEDRWSRDGRPLAVATGMLRQFKTIEFRERPAPAIGDAALVIGNPDLPPLRADFPFLDLPGAQKEADDVAALLDDHHFSVTRLTKATPERIFGSLHARDYRILHLAGHGVHEWETTAYWPPREYPQGRPEPQKRLISGMVLGDGVFLTPGDVEQMRFVPELVFINCCHLGQLSATDGRQPWWLGNKLAANLAAQFIRMGVRAVVAAGWAVDDAAALAFATSFYDRMLSGEPFGRAVQRAREVTFLQHGGTNTWGAFQCYGDPDWRLRARMAAREDAALSPLRSPAHAAVELENLCQRLRMGSGSAPRLLERRLQQLRDDYPDWLGKAEIAAAAGIALGEVERFDEAVDLLTTAIGAQKAEVSLKAVEQRANFIVKAALRQALARPAPAAGGDDDGPLARMRGAIDDLNSLLRLGPTLERLTLLGSAHKRLSWIAVDAATRDQALADAVSSYATAHRMKNAKTVVDAYPLTNWLMAAAVATWFRVKADDVRVPDAQRLAAEGIRWAEAQEAGRPDFWSTVATADCRLAARLQSPSLGKSAVDGIVTDYRRAIGRGASPKEIGSVREQIDYLIDMARRAKKAALGSDLASIRAALDA